MAKVTIYTTKTCPFCLMEKDYLKEKQVEYEEIYVDEKPEEAIKMVEISGQMGVPFTVIDRENGTRITILGFDRPRIAEALGFTS